MRIPTFRIEQTTREHPLSLVGPADFTLQSAGSIDPLELVEDPGYSLYCFDLEEAKAIFVRVEDPLQVESAPFLYVAQAESAVEVASLPLDLFHDIAKEIPKPPLGVALIHSVGRCGSTLLSKVLEATPQVHSLSEPDDLTQLTKLRSTGKIGDDEVKALIESSIRWRCKPRRGIPAEVVAIKTRSQVIALADLFAEVCQDDKHLFLYRDGLSWMRSIFRSWPVGEDVNSVEHSRISREVWGSFYPELQTRTDLTTLGIRMMSWVIPMEHYGLLCKPHLQTIAVRYEEMVSCPKPIFQQILSFLGIEAHDWSAIDEVLAKDSQAGTVFDREERRHLDNQMGPDLERYVLEVIANSPTVKTPDAVLPGTLSCAP